MKIKKSGDEFKRILDSAAKEKIREMIDQKKIIQVKEK